jgi:hypothetical protein
MKIKALQKRVNDCINITLLVEPERQQIMVANAIYPLDGFPELDENTLLAVMDVPVAERKEKTVQISMADTVRDYLDDNRDGDQPAKRTQLEIKGYGGVLLPIYTPYGMMAVAEEAVKPISDCKAAEWFVRKVGDNPVIIVKNGFQRIATFIPCIDWARNDACECLNDLATGAVRMNREMHAKNPDNDSYGCA